MHTCVVIPAYNEEVTIEHVIRRIYELYPEYHVIVVNDGSEDKTSELALESGAEVLTHLINRGVGAAVITGIVRALELSADIIVTIDADLQHDPMTIHRLIEPILHNEAGAVIGSRFLQKKDSERMPFVKKIGNRLLTWFVNLLSHSKVTDSQSGLRAFTNEAINDISLVCDGYGSNSELILELSKRTKIKDVPVPAKYDERSLKKGTNILSGIFIIFEVLAKKIKMKR